MPFDILGYYNTYKDRYPNATLDDIAKDVFVGGEYDKEFSDFNEWKKAAGIDSIINEDIERRKPFEQKLREGVSNVSPFGLVKSLGTGLAEGLTTQLPAMAGEAIEFAGSFLPGQTVEETGKSLKEWAQNKKEEWYGPDIERTGLDRIVYEGSKMLAPSIVPGGIVRTILTGAKGLSNLSKLKIASGATASLFALSQAQSTRDNALQQAKELEAQGNYTEAKKIRESIHGFAPIATGIIEGTGEYFGTKYLGKLFGLGEVEAAKRGAGQLMKDLLKTIGVEVGTEIGQQAGQAMVEKHYGIRPEADAVAEAIDVIGPTTFMTLLTFGLASAANARKKKSPEEEEANRYIENLKQGAMASMAIHEGMKTGKYEGKPFTKKDALEIMTIGQKSGIFTTEDIDRFRERYPILRTEINDMVVDSLKDKITQVVNKITPAQKVETDVPISLGERELEEEEVTPTKEHLTVEKEEHKPEYEAVAPTFNENTSAFEYAEEEAPKEPWEMNLKEFSDSDLGRQEYNRFLDKLMDSQKNNFAYPYNSTIDVIHNKIVKQALSEGKPVPPEVLKDYPELQPKTEKTEAALIAEATKHDNVDDFIANAPDGYVRIFHDKAGVGAGGQVEKGKFFVSNISEPLLKESENVYYLDLPIEEAKNVLGVDLETAHFMDNPKATGWETFKGDNTTSGAATLPDKYYAQLKPKSKLIEFWNKLKEERALIAEARKYKTAEEFVKAQGKTVYHGTPSKELNFGEQPIGNQLPFGVHFQEHIPVAKRFADGTTKVKPTGNEGTIYESIMPKNPLNIDKGLFYEGTKEFAILKEIAEKSKIKDSKYIIEYKGKVAIDPMSIFWKRGQQAKLDVIKDVLTKNGYDQAIVYGMKGTVDPLGVGAPHYTPAVAILDKSLIKTKSQLTDIWNKAQEGKHVTPEVQAMMDESVAKAKSRTQVEVDARIAESNLIAEARKYKTAEELFNSKDNNAKGNFIKLFYEANGLKVDKIVRAKLNDGFYVYHQYGFENRAYKPAKIIEEGENYKVKQTQPYKIKSDFIDDSSADSLQFTVMEGRHRAGLSGNLDIRLTDIWNKAQEGKTKEPLEGEKPKVESNKKADARKQREIKKLEESIPKIEKLLAKSTHKNNNTYKKTSARLETDRKRLAELKGEPLKETTIIEPTKADDKNVTTFKEQKVYIVDKAESLLQDARKRFRKDHELPEEYDVDTKGSYQIPSNYPVIDDGSEKIVVEVPNDGQYKINNQYQAFSTFYKNAKAIRTSEDLTKKRRALPKPTGKPISQIEKEALDDYMTAYDRYRKHGNLKMANELKESIKEDYPVEYKKIVKQEEDERKELISFYKQYSDTTEEEATVAKWEKIISDIDNKKITLKSLSNEFPMDKAPSYREVKEKLEGAKSRLNDLIKHADSTKEKIKLLYPDTYKEMFENIEEQSLREQGEGAIIKEGEDVYEWVKRQPEFANVDIAEIRKSVPDVSGERSKRVFDILEREGHITPENRPTFEKHYQDWLQVKEAHDAKARAEGNLAEFPTKTGLKESPDQALIEESHPEAKTGITGVDIKNLNKDDIDRAVKETPRAVMIHPPSVDEIVFYNDQNGEYIGMAIRWGEDIGFVRKRENSIDTAESLMDDYSKKPFDKIKKSITKMSSGETLEPWQMTKDEYAKSDIGKKEYERFLSALSSSQKANFAYPYDSTVDVLHDKAVSKALAEGKPVLLEVLKDYPYLQKKEEKPKETAKEPWEMTRDEWGKVNTSKITDTDISESDKAAMLKDIGTHGRLVKQALSEGKPVPPEVLKDYPDLIQAVNTEDVGESKINPEQISLTEYDKFWANLREGNVSVQDLKNAFTAVKNSKDAITKELTSMTKAAILKRMDGMRRYRYKNDKKDMVIKAAYGDMINDFSLNKGVTYQMGENYEDVIGRMVDKYTEADIADYAKQVEEARAEYKQRMEEMVKAIKDPETLDDFQTFIRVKGKDKMTPEQARKYDELIANSIKSQNVKEQERKATVREAGQKVNAEITETKHTKTGEPLFVVRLDERVEREIYNEMNRAAKKMGGWYSSYKVGGAVPGFQFKTMEAAEAFKKYVSEGDTETATDIAMERRETKKDQRKATAITKLREMADKILEKANDELTRDRMTNTARRARMANNAEASARADIRIAETMKNIADAIEAGEVNHLSGLRTKVQVETLNNIVNAARYTELRKKYDSYAEQQKHEGEPATIETADYVDSLVRPKIYVNQIRDFARDGLKTDGVKRIAQKWWNRLEKTKEEYIKIESAKDLAELKALSNAVGSSSSVLTINLANAQRLIDMGIETPEMERAAIREFIQYRAGLKEADKVKLLERSLIGKTVGVDFFPTPKATAKEMVDNADIREGMSVLEPSAGNGNIAEAIRESGTEPDVAELSANLREVLKAKGFNVVSQDFLSMTEKRYDRIIMNPPFSNNQDIDHVRHAYSLLKPNGRIVAIMGEGAFFRSDKKATEFRDWLNSIGGTSEKLTEGTFTDRSLMATTGVNARMVVIDKGVEMYSTKDIDKQRYQEYNNKEGDQNEQRQAADNMREGRRRNDLESAIPKEHARQVGIARQGILGRDDSPPRLRKAIQKGQGLIHYPEGYSMPEYHEVLAVAQEFGVDVIPVRDTSGQTNGFLKDGIVFLNMEKGDMTLMQVAMHEISHHLGNQETQNKIDRLSQAFRQYRMSLSRAYGRTLSEAHVLEEYAADIEAGVTNAYGVKLADGLKKGQKVIFLKEKMKNQATQGENEPRGPPLKDGADSDNKYSMTKDKGTANIPAKTTPQAEAWRDTSKWDYELFKEARKYNDAEDFLDSRQYFRNSDSKTGERDVNWQLFTQDRERAQKYGKYEFFTDDKDAVDGYDLIDDVAEFLEKKHPEILKEYGVTNPYKLANEIYPDDIVDSAGIWDNPELVDILWDEFLEPRGIKKIKTADGMIVLDDFDKHIKTKKQLIDIYNKAHEHPNPSRPPEVGGRYSIRTPQNPPASSDPKVLNLYLKDETDAIVQTIMNKLHPKSMTWLETMLKSPEWFDHPQINNIVRLFIRDRNELRHETFNDLNAVDDINATGKTVTEAGLALKNKGLSPAKRITGEVSPEYQLLQDFIDYFDTSWKRNKNKTDEQNLKDCENYMRKHGGTDDVIRVWKLYRKSYDRALEIQIKQMNELIEKLKEEAAFKGEEANIAELQRTLKYALAEMKEWRGYYAPRLREMGDWKVQAYKEHGPLPQNREYYREHRGSELSAQRLAKKLERTGWKVYSVDRVERLPESIYQDVRSVATAKLIDEALTKMTGSLQSDKLVLFNEELLRSVADEIRARGFRSTMISRREGAVIKGYIEDPIKRHLLYINNLAGGVAKSRVARMAMEELLGQVIEGKRTGGINPVKDPEAYKVATNYIEDQLRNLEASDRVIGLAKSIATFKFLGFNIRSLVVNMTALATTAPTSIHQYALDGKGSMIGILKTLGIAGKDYGAYMAGKKLNAEEQAFLEEIEQKGWNDPQYTRDALGTIAKTHSRVWSTMMDGSMYLFGQSEKFNRGTTILAAYRLARKQGRTMEEARELAKEASDKAHGVYGRETLPMWAQGANPAAKIGQMLYVYMKFAHNYLQMLHDVGLKKHNIKGALFAFLSPVVVAGGAALPFKDVIFALFGAILSLLGWEKDPEKWVWDQIREHLGTGAEKVGRHGLTGAAGVDISSSLSIGVGVPKSMMDFTGAIGGAIESTVEAGAALQRKEFSKAAEAFLPTGIANPIRAYREAQEGVTTRRNYPVFDETGRQLRPTPLETVEKTLGFRSSRQATLSERTWEAKRQVAKYNEKRNELYQRYRSVMSSRDRKKYAELVKDVREYNRQVRDNGLEAQVPLITSESLRRQSIRMQKPTTRQAALLQ